MTEPALKLVDSYYAIVSYPSAKLPAQYEALIYAKWLRSLRFGNPLFKMIESRAYYERYHAYLTMLMMKPESVIKMAVLSDDHDVVLGFSVSRGDILDYIYVHKDQRKQGIAKKLMPSGIITFGHITLTAMEIWRRNFKYKHLKFNPFA